MTFNRASICWVPGSQTTKNFVPAQAQQKQHLYQIIYGFAPQKTPLLASHQREHLCLHCKYLYTIRNKKGTNWLSTILIRKEQKGIDQPTLIYPEADQPISSDGHEIHILPTIWLFRRQANIYSANWHLKFKKLQGFSCCHKHQRISRKTHILKGEHSYGINFSGKLGAHKPW